MELEQSTTDFTPSPDPRPKMPEPPPVQLVAVADVMLWTVAGLETEMDRFYVDLLRFERDPDADQLVYRAENFRLRFEVHERPQPRDELRPTGIAVPGFSQVIEKLTDLEIEFVQQRGLAPGQESVLLRDPAGNWVELFELTQVA